MTSERVSATDVVDTLRQGSPEIGPPFLGRQADSAMSPVLFVPINQGPHSQLSVIGEGRGGPALVLAGAL